MCCRQCVLPGASVWYAAAHQAAPPCQAAVPVTQGMRLTCSCCAPSAAALHELGHRLAAGKRGVELAPPLFIPAGLGLLGRWVAPPLGLRHCLALLLLLCRNIGKANCSSRRWAAQP